MRVLHVITSLSLGGAEAMLRNIALGLDSGRFEQQVISLTTRDPIGGQLENGGVKVIALNGGRGILLPHHWVKAWRATRTFRPDIINAWMYHANVVSQVLAGAATRAGRPALIASVRGALNAPQAQKMSLRVVRNIDARLSHRTDTVLFNSRASADQHAALGYDRSRIKVIPNGFDAHRFAPSADDRARVRRALDLGDDFVVGMVARFEAVKGHRLFLAAAAAVVARNPRCRFLLIGRGCNDANEVLRSWIAETGLGSRVLLLGERADIPAVLNALDACVCASISESFPNAIGEAMSCGLPCVVTDVGDCAQLLNEPDYVARAGDAGAIASGILSLADLPATRRAELGARLRERIRTTFSIEKIVAEYAQLYERLADVRGKALR